jgi:hypothetical protein
MLLAREVGVDLFRRLLDPVLDGIPGNMTIRHTSVSHIDNYAIMICHD